MFKLLKDIPFVLGSGSARRQELFTKVGLHFRVQVADVDETLTGADIANSTKQLAYSKAMASEVSDEECLVTADTLVGLNGEILGKPKSNEEAKRMLRKLSGSWHEVYTGVYVKYGTKSISFHEKTSVFIDVINEADMDYYIEKHNPMDKAGSYGIQDWFGLTQVSKIEGCYYNVMGFPLPRFYKEIQKILDYGV